MQVTRTETGGFVISEIEPPLDTILFSILTAADPEGDAAAQRRLFPDPETGPEGETLRDEWREYVAPELQQWFDNAASTVEDDLKQLEAGKDLAIAPEHVDAWLNALNQARLALAARYEITDADMERPVAHLVEEGRDLALFQIHFYGFLQECLIRGLESEE